MTRTGHVLRDMLAFKVKNSLSFLALYTMPRLVNYMLMFEATWRRGSKHA
jgi:hypothetical protein